jgi:phage protein D
MAVDTPAMQRIIEVDGADMPADVEGQLESALVVDRLAMPDTFALVFRDPERDVLERAKLEIGSKVTISTALTGDVPEPLIAGEVTSIEADYDTLGARAIVRGYDLSHRLNAGRKTQTFQNVKLSDVAKQIAGDAGLQAEVDDSGGTIEHVLQPNQSDLDFLYSLAKKIGFDCRVDDEKLYFTKPVESSSGPSEGDLDTEDPVQLVWSRNLLEFRARVSAVAQVSEVKVRGWDVENKEPVIGQADAAATNAVLAQSPADLADKLGGQTLVVVDHPVDNQEAADALAAAKAEQVGSSAFEATAVALGSPALKAGVAVSISGVDPALEGKWAISSTRHEFGAGAYRTHLEFSGRQDRSLHGVVTNSLPGSASGSARAPGVVVALVTNNEDPLDLGRVRLKYPWLSDDAESFWARVMMPGAGPDSGMVWIPEVGDEVLVAFEMGDFSHPIVIGGLWNGVDKPLLGDGLFDAGAIKRRGFISRKGHQIVFFDGDDESGIAMLSQDGKFKLSLNETKGQFHIKADGKLLIEAKSLEIKVDTDAKLEAKGVNLEATGQMKIKGATVALN